MLDGRGIGPARIRSVAVDKGVVTREQADVLSNQEAINLIYRPGLSTAAKVSNLPGRGVGMDVVLSAVQKLGGRVSVSSQLGHGTVTRLSMPLSMAVTRIMVVDIGGSLYGIPIDHVVQPTRLDPDVIALRPTGLDMKEGSSAEAALDPLANGLTPRMILTDLHMDGMSGIDLVKAVRKLPGDGLHPDRAADHRITGRSAQNRQVRGATGWSVKSFNPTKLVALVKEAGPLTDR